MASDRFYVFLGVALATMSATAADGEVFSSLRDVKAPVGNAR